MPPGSGFRRGRVAGGCCAGAQARRECGVECLRWVVAGLQRRPGRAGSPPPTGGPGRAPGGPHILPPRAEAQLNLTADQLKQITELEAEVKTKIEKILTAEQLQKLKQMRPPQRPSEKNETGDEPKGNHE